MYVLTHSYSPACEVSVLFSKERAERIFIDRRHTVLPGTVFLGRVLKKNGNALFVDLGDNAVGYLQMPSFYYDVDGQKRMPPLSLGTKILATVSRESFDNKNLKLSSYVDIDDNLLILAKKKKGYGILRDAPPLFEQALKKFSPRGVVCDSAEAAKRAKEVLPDCELRVSLQSVWETGGVADALEEAVTGGKIMLPSGGSVIIEETATCTCIDVNTGSDGRDVFEVNKEACNEIAHQIALRSLGGQILIDFAGSKKKDDMQKLVALLKKIKGLHVWDVTALGLVEITVKRRYASVLSHFYRPLREKTELAVAESVLRRLWFAVVTGTEPVVVVAPKNVIDVLKGQYARYIADVQNRLGCAISFEIGEKRVFKGIK